MTDLSGFPRRIALLTWDFPPVPTGLGRAAGEIAAGLGQCGVEVAVVTLDRDVDCTTAFGTVTGAARYLRGGLSVMRRRAVLGHLSAPLAFRRALKDVAPVDLVEATNWYAPAALLRGDDPPLVVRHSTPAAKTGTPGGSMRDRIDHRAAVHLEARAARRARGHLSNTAHHRETIETLYGLDGRQPHAVVGLALDEALIARGAGAPAPPEAGRPRIVFIGRPERRKGFDALVAAMGALGARWGEAAPVVDIVGCTEKDAHDAGHAEIAAPVASGRLVFHGRASDEAVHRLLDRAHAVVAPSRYESYGLVYREAAAFGRPVIACAEDPSAREFANVSGAAVLAPECNGDALAGTIAALLIDAARQKDLAAAGRAHAATLTRRALGEASLALYGQVLR